jgi:hypothetical protein
VIEPAGDCDLVAEIARQLDQPVTLVGARLGLDHDCARIGRSVVDDNNLARRVERLEQGVEAPQQDRDDGLLVEDGHDEGINISRRHGGGLSGSQSPDTVWQRPKERLCGAGCVDKLLRQRLV